MGDRPDPDQLQAWVLHDGLPAAEVGARLGLSRAGGYSWLRRYGIAPGRPRLAQADLVARWRGGEPATQIADNVGIAASAVRERLVAAAVLDLPRRYFVVGSADDPLPEHLLRRWYDREGFSAIEVAALTNTTPRQVRYRLAHYRLSRGRPGPSPKVRRRLPADLLTDLYLHEGRSCAQIAAGCQVSAETVRTLLDEYGIERRAGATARPAPLDPDAVARYTVGELSLAGLARETGYLTAAGNPATRRLRVALEAAGVPSRRGRNWSKRLRAGDTTDTDPATLRRLYVAERLPIAAVAERLGWRTPAGRPAVTYTRSRLLAAGVVLRAPGPSNQKRRPHIHQTTLDRAHLAILDARATVARSRELSRHRAAA